MFFWTFNTPTKYFMTCVFLLNLFQKNDPLLFISFTVKNRIILHQKMYYVMKAKIMNVNLEFNLKHVKMTRIATELVLKRLILFSTADFLIF